MEVHGHGATRHHPRLGSDADELRAIQEEIARARAEVARSVVVLRDRVTRSVDWHGWVRSRPLVAVCVSFGIGLWLGVRRR
ncbi:MAG: hypothetical protein LBM75_09735 [Myxococcales bacterium]|jgi:ElaB/YqjD/DUF883 family membrane-anchored ribosome-binding protein|nr:hypothetical protein [Myxococcales bacterium]